MSFMGPLLGLDRVMTQSAQILRDQAIKDEFGAKGSRDWQPLGQPVACFLWWGTGRILTRAGSIHEHPEETVDINTGGMLLPAGTDVTPRDRIGPVLAQNGVTVITAGPLEVLSVVPYEGVTEIEFRSTT